MKNPWQLRSLLICCYQTAWFLWVRTMKNFDTSPRITWDFPSKEQVWKRSLIPVQQRDVGIQLLNFAGGRCCQSYRNCLTFAKKPFQNTLCVSHFSERIFMLPTQPFYSAIPTACWAIFLHPFPPFRPHREHHCWLCKKSWMSACTWQKGRWFLLALLTDLHPNA